MTQKTVFLLGAGFEKDYGQPLMSEFAEDIESLNKNIRSFLENQKYLSIAERRMLENDEMLSKDIDIYLSLIKNWTAEKQEDIEEIIDFSYRFLKKDYRRSIFCLFHYVLFLRELSFYRDKRDDKPSKYYRALLNDDNAVILTTNYTSFIEKEHPKHKLNLIYGANKYFLDPNYFGLRGIRYPIVLKLHGSVGFYEEPKVIEMWFTTDRKQFIAYSEFKSTRGDLGQDTTDSGAKQIIIPPVKDKDNLIAEHKKILQPIWDQAEIELQNANRLICVGYGFVVEDKKIWELLKNLDKEAIVYIMLPNKPDRDRLEKIKEIFKKYYCYFVESKADLLVKSINEGNLEQFLTNGKKLSELDY